MAGQSAGQAAGIGLAFGLVLGTAAAPTATPVPLETIANATVLENDPPAVQHAIAALWPMTVAARFTIDRVGRPRSIQVGPAEVPSEFLAATRAAIEGWTFWPALGACRHVEQDARIDLVFDEKRVALEHFELEPVTARRAQPAADFAWLDPTDHGDTRALQRTARAGFVEAVPLKLVQPRYPAKASRAALPGYAFVMLLVGADGRVLQATATDAWSPDSKLAPQFGAEAVRAVKQWRFQPAQQDGVPLQRWACHRILFNMKLGR